jgi:hypothetical protein
MKPKPEIKLIWKLANAKVKVKVKVKLSLCFISTTPRRNGGGHCLTLALNGGEWSASRSGLFRPRERALGNHWIGGWVGRRAGLDKRRIPSSRREPNPNYPLVQPVANTEVGINNKLFFKLISILRRQCTPTPHSVQLFKSGRSRDS